MSESHDSGSDEYAPTTSDIRVAWISNNIDATDESPMPISEWERQFDGWFARERARTLMDFANLHLHHADWVKARAYADAILKGER